MILYIYFTDESKYQIIRGGNQEISDTSSEVKSLRSKKYLSGALMDACNIICRITPDPYDNQPRNLTVISYEFSPFMNNKDYCWYIDNVINPAQCSGSKSFQVRYGPYESKDGWKFKIKLSKSVESVPQIRFWVSLSSKYLNNLLT